MENRDFVDILKDRIEADPDLTEAGLAKLAGLDNSTIRQMIKNRRSPRIDTAVKICQALGDTVESFLSEARDPVTREILQCLAELSHEERRMLLAAARGLRVDHHAEDQRSLSASSAKEPHTA